MEKYRVGVIGGTGMVGQRFVTLLENHPWFQLTAIAASSRSAGKTYEEAIGGRWALMSPCPGRPRTWWCSTRKQTSTGLPPRWTSYSPRWT